MPHSLVLEEVAQLSIEERLALISDIWETIVAEDVPLPMPEGLTEEIERRLARHAANPSAAREWSVIRDDK